MSELDWIIGIGIPIIIALVIFFYDGVKTPLAIFVLLNIGLAVMVYAGYVNVGILFLSIIFSVIFTYISVKTKGVD